MINLFIALILSSTQPIKFEKPVVEILKQHNIVYIQSKESINNVYVEDMSEWCSYFVQYSVDKHEASIKITTDKSPLNLVVETEPYLLGKKKHIFKIRKK
jgi:hypothetical protein